MTTAPMPTVRRNLGVGVVNGILYAVGGSNCCIPLGDTAAYDPVSNSWATKANLQDAREYLGLGVVNGILYAVGGDVNDGETNLVEAYDPATDTWTFKSPMPTALWKWTGRFSLPAWSISTRKM